jgi:hypothetical protein
MVLKEFVPLGQSVNQHKKYTELLGFFTFLSFGILENRKHDILETASVSILRWGGGEDTHTVGPLRKS